MTQIAGFKNKTACKSGLSLYETDIQTWFNFDEMIFTLVGMALSYGPQLPTGATIVVLAGACYLLVTLGSWALGRRKLKGK